MSDPNLARSVPKAELLRPGALPRIVTEHRFWHRGLDVEEWIVAVTNEVSQVAWARGGVGRTRLNDGRDNPLFAVEYQSHEFQARQRAEREAREAFEAHWRADLEPLVKNTNAQGESKR